MKTLDLIILGIFLLISILTTWSELLTIRFYKRSNGFNRVIAALFITVTILLYLNIVKT